VYFLPLSPRALLVGSRDSNPPIVLELRHALVRCSLEYFIAHENSYNNNILREQVGKDAYLFSTEQMEEIIVEIING
jgi:hypothetical protein